MAHFIIENIGPITHTEFDLNRVNVFIGPQSVGKSTIAKIISFCLWLEKTAIRQQNVDNIDLTFIEEKLISYHKMNSYFRKESHISYHGTAINMEYIYQMPPIVEKTNVFPEAEIGKVAYIPAERSIISMGNVSSFKLGEDYVREFIFEWLTARSKFVKENAVQIPGTDVSYYYDETRGDTIELLNGNPIFLTESSSGLQSATPLFIYCKYVAEWIYTHNADMSYEELNKVLEGVSRMLFKALSQDTTPPNVLKGNRYEDNAELMTNFARVVLSDENHNNFEPSYKFLIRYAERLRKPHFTQLIIEEPELNLFPETQVEILYSILRLIQNERKDSLIITTHSPYILYALNNCMLANIVRDKMPQSKMGKIKCSDIILNPNDVSVYELEGGTFRPIEHNIDAGKYTIQDNSGLIRQNFFDRIMGGIMDDFNSLLQYRYK